MSYNEFANELRSLGRTKKEIDEEWEDYLELEDELMQEQSGKNYVESKGLKDEE